MKEFLSKKGLGFYFVALTLLTTVIGFIFYLVNAIQTNAVSAVCIIAIIVAIAGLGVTLVKNFFNIGICLSTIAYGVIIGDVLTKRGDYLGYSLTGQVIGGAGEHPFWIFVVMAVFVIVSLILSIASQCLKIEK